MAGRELSKREREIATAVAAGLTNKEIASKTGLALPTVKNYLGSAFDKLGVRSRTQLTLRMLAEGRPRATRVHCRPGEFGIWLGDTIIFCTVNTPETERERAASHGLADRIVAALNGDPPPPSTA